MTDSDREKQIGAVNETLWRRYGPVVPLERAQELERERDDLLDRDQTWRDDYLRLQAERDEAVAAARDFAEALRYLADPENWLGDPLDLTSTLHGHFTPFELARDVLARAPSFLPPRHDS